MYHKAGYPRFPTRPREASKQKSVTALAVQILSVSWSPPRHCPPLAVQILSVSLSPPRHRAPLAVQILSVSLSPPFPWQFERVHQWYWGPGRTS